MAKFLGGDGKGGSQGWGAYYKFSIYWRFLDEKTYYSDEFLLYTKYAIVVLNIWHFFVKKNALRTCLANLVYVREGLTKPWSHRDVKFCVETIWLGFMCGVIMCPGGHTQFQFWYTYMLPILIHMVGLPSFVSLFLFQLIFAADHSRPNIHHLFLMALTLWLITVGPRRHLFNTGGMSAYPSRGRKYLAGDQKPE